MRDREKPRFKTRAPSLETVKRRATQSGGTFDAYLDSKVPRYKVTDGQNNIRILPAPEIDGQLWGDEDKWEDSWGIPIHVHYGIGPDRSTYLCPKKTNNDACPICESYAEVAQTDEEAAKKLRTSKRVLAYVIDRDDEKAGPLAWAMPATKVEKEIQLLCLDSGEAINVVDEEEGYDISFTKSGKDTRTEYQGIRIARKASAISDNEKTQAEWLDYIMDNPLPKILKIYDYDYLESVYMGQKSTKDTEEDNADSGKRGDTEERQSTRTRSSSSKRNEEEETAPPEEEEQPKASKGGKKKGGTKYSAEKVADMEDDVLEDLAVDLGLDLDDFSNNKKLRAGVLEELEEQGLLEEEDATAEDEPAEEPEEEARPRSKRTAKVDEDVEDRTSRKSSTAKAKESMQRLNKRKAA